jgi:hypothetical protein
MENNIKSHRLNKWIAGRCSNTAFVAFVTAHSNVTFLTPVYTPTRSNYKIK